MKNIFNQVKFLTFGLVTLGLVFSAQADDPDKLPTAETVLMKFTEASGGVAKFKAIKSMKMTGKLKIPSMGIEGSLEVIQAMPDKIYTKAIIPGAGTETQASNGKHAWHLSTTTGARLIKDKELAQLVDQIDMTRMTDPMKFYKEAKVVGIEEVDGDKCYKLKITKKNGDEVTEFFSIKSGLQMKSTSTLSTQMGDLDVTSMLSDYKEVDGLKFPMLNKISMSLGERMLQYDSIEINKEVDQKLFEVPDQVQALIDAEMKDKDKEDSDS